MFGAVSGVLASRNHIVLQPTFEGTLVSVPIFLYPDANTFRSNSITQVPISYSSTISTTFRTDLIANVPVSYAPSIGTTFWSEALPIVPLYITQGTITTFSSSALPSVSLSLKGADAAATELYFGNVVLLMHMDGTSGGTTFIDSSLTNASITNIGSSTTSVTQQKFGTSSASFTGSNYLTVPNPVLGTDDWAIEFSAYMAVSPANERTIFKLGGSALPFSFIRISTSSDRTFAFSWGATYAYLHLTALALNSWHTFAITRSRSNLTTSVLRVFLNGVMLWEQNISAALNLPGNSGPLYIGSGPDEAAGFNGYIDEFRITKGFARYTSNYTIETAAFPNVGLVTPDPDFSKVALLLHGNGTNGSTVFIDSSPAPKSVARSGDAKLSTTQFKFSGSSMYFDGTGDFLSVPSSTAFDLSTFDFAAEGWFWPTNVALGASIMSRRFDNATGWCLVINGAGGISWRLVLGGVWTDGFCATTTGLIQNNTWYHIAATRSGSTFRIFVNGVQVSTATNAGAVQDTPYALRVGTSTIYTNEVPFTGYMDDVRLTIGAPRYTANFTTPTLQFSDS